MFGLDIINNMENKTLLYIAWFLIILGLSPVIGIIGLVFTFIIAFLFWDNCNTFCNILIYPFHLMIYPLDLFKNMPSLLIGCLVFLIIGLIFHFKYKGQGKQIINLNK